MGDTNYFSGIVKVLENPIQVVSNSNIPVTTFRVELAQIRNQSKILHLIFWGNLARDVINYYEINDYIIIEGYLSIRNKNNNDPRIKTVKKIEIAVLKVYPFLFNPNRLIIKV